MEEAYFVVGVWHHRGEWEIREVTVIIKKKTYFDFVRLFMDTSGFLKCPLVYKYLLRNLMTSSCSQNWRFNCLSGGFCGYLTHSLTNATERHSEKVALFGVTVCSVLTPNGWWETGSSNDNQPQSIHSYKQSRFSWIQFNIQAFVVWSTTLASNRNMSALQLVRTL
jgi:hypothetical protein